MDERAHPELANLQDDEDAGRHGSAEDTDVLRRKGKMLRSREAQSFPGSALPAVLALEAACLLSLQAVSRPT